MKLGLRSLAAIMALAAPLAGCGTSPQEFMRPPNLSPVGSGLVSQDDIETEATALANAHSPGPSRRQDLYTDQRITRVGDIVTVVISINDKATFGNTTDRSTTGTSAFQWSFGYTPPTSGSSSSSGQPGTAVNNINSTSSSQGQGDINRSEQIQVSVPAVVTQVLPNGNLTIHGSQEVRVNFEIRQLTVAGIVHPADISRSNTIAYDRVAEARISYGGRGRLSEVQQPAWGHQIYDYLKPF